MTPEDRLLAEAVVRRLCEGARIGGIRFGAPQLLIDDAPDPVRGQVYLNLESRWTVFEGRPGTFPASEDEVPDRSMDEELALLCTLRHRTIERVELGQEAPHLVFTLEGGAVFFLNGKDPQYECWQIGVAFGDPQQLWLVVAMANGDVAVWTPDASESSLRDERGERIGDTLRERRLAEVAHLASRERRKIRVIAALLLVVALGFLAAHYYLLRHNFHDYLIRQNFYDLLMVALSGWIVGFSGPVLFILGLWVIIRARPLEHLTPWERVVVGAMCALGLLNAFLPKLLWPWV